MRALCASLIVGAACLFSASASAQGLGDKAQEAKASREKAKTGSTAPKVYTESRSRRNQVGGPLVAVVRRALQPERRGA